MHQVNTLMDRTALICRWPYPVKSGQISHFPSIGVTPRVMLICGGSIFIDDFCIWLADNRPGRQFLFTMDNCPKR